VSAATDTSGGDHELIKVQAFVAKHPSIMPMFISFSFAMALGNIFIYQLQRDYGALVVTTTTTVRKFLSVLASALPKDGVCGILPLLPDGLCGFAAFPGCALVSCATIRYARYVPSAIDCAVESSQPTFCNMDAADQPNTRSGLRACGLQWLRKRDRSTAMGRCRPGHLVQANKQPGMRATWSRRRKEKEKLNPQLDNERWKLVICIWIRSQLQCTTLCAFISPTCTYVR
jgi:hypothetical protein